ncbi:MAG: putative rane protein [Herbinix sp.]|jgi:hypothetical protein|nr:putative rane protein [Herbinix sp.]
MGLLQRLFGRKQREATEKTINLEESSSELKRTIKLNTKQERLGLIRENCESIADGNRQMEEAKVEYQAVTSYLTDMQRIDMIPLEQREVLEDAARKIINLNKERNKFKNKDSKLSDEQYRLFERYNLQIPKELPKLYESEKYQVMIQGDLDRLEKEKKLFTEEQEEIHSKQNFLKGIGFTIFIIVSLLFLLFGFLWSVYDQKFILPFLLTVFMAMVFVLYVFMEARKNTHKMKLSEIKLNRVIVLLNKVKIKAVNNRNYIEYTYSKYMIKNYHELKTLWEEYIKRKDEERRYQSNTELLHFYESEMVKELKKFAIADSEIWIYQASAIVDSKEMVEVRHRLNVRRQKLRERMDAYMKQKEDALTSIYAVMDTYPDCVEEAMQLMRKFRIESE